MGRGIVGHCALNSWHLIFKFTLGCIESEYVAQKGKGDYYSS